MSVKVEVAAEISSSMSDAKKSKILDDILEQVDLVGEENLDALGYYLLTILKSNYLIFRDGSLVEK